MANACRQLWRGLWSSDDGEISQFSPVFFSNDGRIVVYACHRFIPIGMRSAADKSLRLPPTQKLSLLSHVHSSPSSRLNQTPMLAPSRNTTEQRYQTDALELDNDSGSLTACGNQASKTGLSLCQNRGSQTAGSAYISLSSDGRES